MSPIGLITALLSTAAGACGTIGLLVLCVASAPNSSEAQAAQIRFWAITASAVGVITLIGAITLLVFARPWLAAAVGGLPMAVLIGLLIVASLPRS